MDPLRSDYKYNHISTATTTQVATGNCTLVGITVNTTAAGTISIYDNAAGATTNLVGVIKASVLEQTFFYTARFSQGIQITTAAASDITVIYSKN